MEFEQVDCFALLEVVVGEVVLLGDEKTWRAGAGGVRSVLEK